MHTKIFDDANNNLVSPWNYFCFSVEFFSFFRGRTKRTQYINDIFIRTNIHLYIDKRKYLCMQEEMFMHYNQF